MHEANRQPQQIAEAPVLYRLVSSSELQQGAEMPPTVSNQGPLDCTAGELGKHMRFCDLVMVDTPGSNHDCFV